MTCYQVPLCQFSNYLTRELFYVTWGYFFYPEIANQLRWLMLKSSLGDKALFHKNRASDSQPGDMPASSQRSRKARCWWGWQEKQWLLQSVLTCGLSEWVTTPCALFPPIPCLVLHNSNSHLRGPPTMPMTQAFDVYFPAERDFLKVWLLNL